MYILNVDHQVKGSGVTGGGGQGGGIYRAGKAIIPGWQGYRSRGKERGRKERRREKKKEEREKKRRGKRRGKERRRSIGHAQRWDQSMRQ